MAERTRGKETPNNLTIDIYTPENIQGLEGDSHLHDALALLRQGVWELRDINGMDMTERQKNRYTPQMSVLDPEDNTFEKFWAGQKSKNWDPFLMVGWNTKDGTVGVVEGREYTAGERAMYINWIVVRNWGSNDADRYSYRGTQTASDLYDKVEEVGRSHGVTVLLAAVNSLNVRSAGFFKKKGFVHEQLPGYVSSYGEVSAFRTKNGIYIPSYPLSGVDSGNNPINANMNFWTKRLNKQL